MKTLITTLALFFITTTAVNAQFWKRIKGNGNYTTENRTVSSFNSVALSSSFEVELIEENEGKIKIKADENLIPYIVTKVENNNLKIRFKKGYNYVAKKGIKIKVGFKNLQKVALLSSGDIFCKTPIKTDEFKVKATGSGDVKLTLNAQSVEAKLVGSGDVDLKGNTNKFKGSVVGSGDISAFKLKANVVTINIAGSGDIEAYAIKEINGKIVGSGDIEYKGNPEIVKLKTIGSGDIKKVR